MFFSLQHFLSKHTVVSISCWNYRMVMFWTAFTMMKNRVSQFHLIFDGFLIKHNYLQLQELGNVFMWHVNFWKYFVVFGRPISIYSYRYIKSDRRLCWNSLIWKFIAFDLFSNSFYKCIKYSSRKNISLNCSMIFI